MELSQADLELFRERMLARFTPEDMDKYGLWDARPDKRMRKELGSIDLEFFLRFYLDQHFTKMPATFHRDTYRVIEADLEDNKKHNEVFVWPRGHGKTTTLVQGTTLWAICYAKRHCIPIVADSHDQAKMHLETLKTEIETNERIREDFGNLQGSLWQADNIVTTTGVNVFALGKGMKLRGRKFGRYRPDMILVDDPEDLEAAMSPTQSLATENWLLRSAIPSGWTNTCTFVIGNIIHHNCLVNKLLGNPSFRGHVYRAIESFAERDDLWQEWEKLVTDKTIPTQERLEKARHFYEDHKQEMLQGVKVSWPEGYTYYDLMLTRLTIGRSAFATEYQNDPDDPEDRFFRSYQTYRRELRPSPFHEGMDEYLVPTDGRAAVRLNDCTLVAATDPSMGEKVGADPSAIVILARSPNGQKFLLEIDRQRRHPDTIIEHQKAWYVRYPNILRWVIEKNQFQAFFASESRRRALEDGQDIPFVPRDTVANKILRIQSLQPLIENGEVLFNENGQETIKEEMTRWKPFKEGQGDDALDALEMANKEMDLYAAGVSAVSLTQGDTHKFNSQLTVNKVFDDGYDELEQETIPEYIQREREKRGLSRACVPRIFDF